jgi:flagellar basal body-associated protein FliL
MGRKSLGILIVAILIGILAGNVVGQVLAIIFNGLSLENNVVEKVLIDSYVYKLNPIEINLIVMTLTLGFSLDFNVLSFLGIGLAWYYVKYSY